MRPLPPAYRAFYDEHARALYFYLRAHVASNDVDDVAQEIWLGAAAGWPPPAKKARAWLWGIAKHKVADYHDAKARLLALDSNEIQPTAYDPDDAGLEQEIEKLLQAVPDPEQREALVLAALSWTAKEIGELQGISEDAAKKRVQRARAAAKGTLAGGMFFAVDLDRLFAGRPGEIEALWDRLRRVLDLPEDPPGEANDGTTEPTTVREPTPAVPPRTNPAALGRPPARRIPDIRMPPVAPAAYPAVAWPIGVAGVVSACVILLLSMPRPAPLAAAPEPACIPAPAVEIPAPNATTAHAAPVSASAGTGAPATAPISTSAPGPTDDLSARMRRHRGGR